jgi:hypothetical protein
MLRKGIHEETENAAGIENSMPSDVPCEALSRLLRRAVKVQPSPRILMLGELCGENVNFLGERGFRVTVQTDVRHNLQGPYAGALIWDGLWRMPMIQARQRTRLLYDLLSPGAAVLTLFGAPGTDRAQGRTRYRILSESLIRSESVKGSVALAHSYQNLDIIQMFKRFDLEKLHTRRDGQREALFFKPWSEDRHA